MAFFGNPPLNRAQASTLPIMITLGDDLTGGLAVAALHTLAMFVVAGAIALLVYEVVGLTVLRRAWFNLDRMWAIALVGAGVITLVQA